MSKMPAKKKSCFQITSVITAQSANSITEETESLDDPDESRTEDVSSEIFDVSRATDYGPEDVVGRSSSEETLSNVCEAETPGSVSPNLPHEGIGLIGANGGAASRGSGQGAALGLANQVSTATATPTASSVAQVTSQSPATTATCSSRFRVIKLDHGSGEPYRRGRWTCTEYYDRDSDSNLISRTGDTIRHTSTFDHSADRDSGLGATGGSAVHVLHTSECAADSCAVSQLLQPDKMNQPSQQQPFLIGQQAVGGMVCQGTAQQMYPGAVTSQQTTSQSHTAAQSANNGAGSSSRNVHTVQSTISATPQQQPTASLSQPQAFTYSQVQSGHMISTQPTGQTEYVQHITVLQSQGTPQQPTASVNASTGAPSSLPGQHLQAGGTQLVGLLSKSGDSMSQGSGLIQSGQSPQSHPVHVQHPGSGAQSSVPSIGLVQQKPINQQVSGSSLVSGIPGGHHTMAPGIQSVPAAMSGTGVTGIQSTVPSVSATLVTMPIAPSNFVQSPLSNHTTVSRSNSLTPTVGLPAMTSNVHTSLPQSNVNQVQTPSQSLVGQIDDRRKSEPLPQPPMSLFSEKPFMKVSITDTLANPLNLPVFGFPVDGDDDSSSSANVVAIDNKIEQAMDLVKSHLMYAVREEVEVLKEQIKELIEKNSTLERENALLKNLSNNDQLSQLSAQAGLSTCQQQPPPVTTAPISAPPQNANPAQQPNVSSA
ncbi:TSC22 domain family member 2 S homeolog [Xenopus laevis]|uniref:MGC81241 protein n=1 Tax=Xenopus laevis TaxID=8355 RepID=Q6NU54_XENLA|nr:TSC22 domain family member 2 S homeolog [Xenopus laevis]AAH68747.1 MGC81241 protein [Xenopus laevis]